MSETKHTPGPWNSGTVEANETRYFQSVFSSKGRCLGVVYGDTNLKWTDEDRANVRLIAAAPRMLAALERVYANAAENPEWIRSIIGPVLRGATGRE